jgi:uncharacterized integral membrane protein
VTDDGRAILVSVNATTVISRGQHPDADRRDKPRENHVIIIALLVLIAALIFGVDLIFQNHHHVSVAKVFGQSLGLHNEADLIVVGVIIGAAIMLALALMGSGLRRKGSRAVARRLERKDVRRTRGQRDELVSDNERLRAELAARGAAGRASEDGTGSLAEAGAGAPSP